MSTTQWPVVADKDTGIDVPAVLDQGGCVDTANHGLESVLYPSPAQRVLLGFNLAGLAGRRILGGSLDLTPYCPTTGGPPCRLPSGALATYALRRDFDEGDGTPNSGATWCAALASGPYSTPGVFWSLPGASSDVLDRYPTATTVVADAALSIPLSGTFLTDGVLAGGRIAFLLVDDTGGAQVQSRHAAAGQPTLTLTVCGP